MTSHITPHAAQVSETKYTHCTMMVKLHTRYAVKSLIINASEISSVKMVSGGEREATTMARRSQENDVDDAYVCS